LRCAFYKRFLASPKDKEVVSDFDAKKFLHDVSASHFEHDDLMKAAAGFVRPSPTGVLTLHTSAPSAGSQDNTQTVKEEF
jgi:hypothetical protein